MTVFLRAVICCRVTVAVLFTKNIRSFFALTFVASGLFGIKFYPKFRKNVFATSIFRMQFRSGFRVGFVPFGWPFSLPLISASQRNPSRVLKFFCLSNRLCFCGGMCLAMCFFVVAFCYISKLFYCRLGAIELLFLLCVFLHRNCVVFSDFFAVTNTLKGKECLQTRCFPTLKNKFLRVNSLFCDEGLV